jgi:NAD-dependent deacetylase
VLFGELLPEAAITRAGELCERADVLLCIGSSLEVHPVAGLPLLTHEHGGAMAILTLGDTPLDDLATVRLRGDVVEEMGALVDALDSAPTHG